MGDPTPGEVYERDGERWLPIAFFPSPEDAWITLQRMRDRLRVTLSWADWHAWSSGARRIEDA